MYKHDEITAKLLAENVATIRRTLDAVSVSFDRTNGGMAFATWAAISPGGMVLYTDAIGTDGEPVNVLHGACLPSWQAYCSIEAMARRAMHIANHAAGLPPIEPGVLYIGDTKPW